MEEEAAAGDACVAEREEEQVLLDGAAGILCVDEASLTEAAAPDQRDGPGDADAVAAADAVQVGEYGSFFAVPTPPLEFPAAATTTGCRGSLLPPLTVRAPRPLLGRGRRDVLRTATRLLDDFWLGMRYAADRELRPYLRFSLFARGYLRLFIVPEPDDRAARCLVTTRTAAMVPEIQRWARQGQDMEEEPSFLPLLQECALGPTFGSDWPSSAALAAEKEDEDQPFPSSSVHLYPHQRRSVAWMLAVEQEGHEQATFALEELCPPLQIGHILSIDDRGAVAVASEQRGDEEGRMGRQPEPTVTLPRGGLIAHPVGAGKTLVAAGLVGSTAARAPARAPTLLLVPDHILFQWEQELARVLPSDGAIHGSQAAYVLVGHEEARPGGARHEEVVGRRWHRLVVDEGQQVAQDEELYEAVKAIEADHRWVLSATPEQDLRWIMGLVYGREVPYWEYRCTRRAFVQQRCLRDRPSACLPLPPLRDECVAVTLTGEEIQTLVLANAMGQTLERTVELALCPEWAVPPPADSLSEDEDDEDEDEQEEEDKDNDELEESYSSFDEWYARATTRQAQALADAEAALEAAKGAVRSQENRFLAMAAAARGVEGQGEPLEALTVVLSAPLQQQQQQQHQQARDGGIALGSLTAPLPSSRFPWAGGVYHHIGDHNGLPLYRWRRAGRYFAYAHDRWGLYESDPTLAAGDAPTTTSILPAFASETTPPGQDPPARPDLVQAWYRRPGLFPLVAKPSTEGLAERDGRLWRSRDGRVVAVRGVGAQGSGSWWFVAEGMGVAEDLMEKVEGVEMMADDERGVDDALWLALDAAEARVTDLRKSIAFVDGLRATMADAATECCVCMVPLRGQTVTVLSCLHAFDDRCVRVMLGMAAAVAGPSVSWDLPGSGAAASSSSSSATSSVACPVCRKRTRRREMSTFLHQPSAPAAAPVPALAPVPAAPDASTVAAPAALLPPPPPVAAAPSSKLEAVVEKVKAILAASPTDKVVVFSKWGYALELLSNCLYAMDVPSLCLGAGGDGWAGASEQRQRRGRRRARGRGQGRPGALVSPLGPEARVVEEARALAAWNSSSVAADDDEHSDDDDDDDEEGDGDLRALRGIRVLLLRFDREASGLNLHGGRHVMLVHPYINPTIQAAELVPLAESQAFERQAVGRCHRYPQHQEVRLWRFYARGTVEEEMYGSLGLLSAAASSSQA